MRGLNIMQDSHISSTLLLRSSHPQEAQTNGLSQEQKNMFKRRFILSFVFFGFVIGGAAYFSHRDGGEAWHVQALMIICFPSLVMCCCFGGCYYDASRAPVVSSPEDEARIPEPG